LTGERAGFGGGDGKAGGKMDEVDGVGGLVALLPAGARAARDVEAAIGEEGVVGEEA